MTDYQGRLTAPAPALPDKRVLLAILEPEWAALAPMVRGVPIEMAFAPLLNPPLPKPPPPPPDPRPVVVEW